MNEPADKKDEKPFEYHDDAEGCRLCGHKRCPGHAPEKWEG